jgi:WD40 repeat protein
VSDDKTIKIWNPLAGIELNRHTGHTDVITGASFVAETSKIVSSSEDGTVKLWETYAEKTHVGHSKTVNSIAFSPTGSTFVSASDDLTGTAIFLLDAFGHSV